MFDIYIRPFQVNLVSTKVKLMHLCFKSTPDVLKCILHCVKRVQIRSFFWSVFSRVQTEYGEILCISPYSVRMRENTDQKKLFIGHISRSIVSCFLYDTGKIVTEIIR